MYTPSRMAHSIFESNTLDQNVNMSAQSNSRNIANNSSK